MSQFCKSCNADDPPHAPGCWAADLHDMHEKGRLNGLLEAQAIALQCALNAPTPDAREGAEVAAGMIAGAALGMSMHLPTSHKPESHLAGRNDGPPQERGQQNEGAES